MSVMRKSVSHDILETLMEDIREGRAGAGTRFPTERELASRFGAARNTVRRAMDQLEEQGLIVRQVGRGTYVTDREAGRTESADTPADVSPRDLIEARLMIEPSVAAAAAANATEADVALLTEAQNASAATTRMEDFERHDAEIHRLLFRMAHNEVIRLIESQLRAMRDNADWLTAKRAAYSNDLKARYIAQHGAIIDAIARRSPGEARRAMQLHLEEVRRALLDE
jgi:DNA-binding FadR family transcriptional regulator